ncbi:MAG TPA: response regulator transcription factor [Anaerolineae bacterium]|nr:response regulator transcription factor [Anaerolineae bacterium]HQH38028.1 response regulator transcription factor [Anaerolineae bacterium]
MSENIINPSMIRVLIVDDHPSVRQGVRTMLTQAPDIEVVGEAADGTEAMALVEQLRPDVVLLDVEMPGPRAWEVEAWIRQQYPDIVGLVLSAHNRDAYLVEMMDAGVVGYLDKQLPAPQLVQAIRRARQGEGLFSVEQLHRAQRWREDVRDCWNSLTPREQEVLIQLARGKTTPQLAVALRISPRTVETHIQRILAKLEIPSTREAIVWVWEHGLSEDEDPST